MDVLANSSDTSPILESVVWPVDRGTLTTDLLDEASVAASNHSGCDLCSGKCEDSVVVSDPSTKAWLHTCKP